MNNILDNLFHKEKIGIGNKAIFIKNGRERHPEINIKDIQEYLYNQEVSQIHTKVKKTYLYKISFTILSSISFFAYPPRILKCHYLNLINLYSYYNNIYKLIFSMFLCILCR
jgi:hypothetical protein